MISVGAFENEFNLLLINRNSTPFLETLATPESPIQRTIERFCNPY